MFKDNANEQDKAKKTSTVDKVVMGAIIGTAIGSAIGAVAAPQEGKETRKLVKEKSKEALSLTKEAAKLTKETGQGMLTLAKKLWQRRKEKKLPSQSPGFDEMQKIPHEQLPENLSPPENVDRN